jgi:hypothetical protein
MKFGKHLSRGGRIPAPFTNLGGDEVWSGNRTWAAVGSNWSHSKVSDQKASYRKDVPDQLVDATPSELKALMTGGVYDPKKTYTAFGDAEN